MADISATDLLKHRQMIMCRRSYLGVKVNDKLSQAANIDCEEKKMVKVDTLMCVLARYKADEAENCLESDEICRIIKHIYTLLPESC